MCHIHLPNYSSGFFDRYLPTAPVTSVSLETTILLSAPMDSDFSSTSLQYVHKNVSHRIKLFSMIV